ncbi:MAG: P-loop NTPase fold protein [bacterium]|nr:P-loop NTPase fold protein [bacterium]
MWSDNAATVDLLGYEDLLQEIVDLAVDDSLQPLTIGAFADWGAGKSTLLNLAADALRKRGALVVEFSPWLVEGYDDVKACLLGAVVDAIAAHLAPESKSKQAQKLLRSLQGRIDWLRLVKLGASAVVPIAGVGIDLLQGLLKSDDNDSMEQTIAGSAEVSRGFHREFEELIKSTEGIRPVVVLIDDLDRCLPDQVIETLEAIRLFLSTPGTAFVIAADERLVRDAVRRRYAAASEIEVDLPREYLEKLVHVAMRIPPLTRPDTESYCNLLVAERLLDHDDFTKVLASAQGIRKSGELKVSCNVGIVREALPKDLPADLEAEFGLIEQLIGPLASGLKGNPRQIKRYLNTFDMRRRTAKRREMPIDEAVLAKLVVLEYVRDDRYRELHGWQRQGNGLSEEMARLEAAQEDLSSVEADKTVGAWAADPWTRDWLAVEPKLAGIDLAPYFFLSRDRVSDGGASSHLPPGLQVLVADLESEAASIREPAIDKVKELQSEEQLMLLEASSVRLRALPDKQPMMMSMIEIAASEPSLVSVAVAALASIPYSEVSPDIPLVVASHFSGTDTTAPTTDLLVKWEKQNNSGPLAKAALMARKRIGDDSGDV